MRAGAHRPLDGVDLAERAGGDELQHMGEVARIAHGRQRSGPVLQSLAGSRVLEEDLERREFALEHRRQIGGPLARHRPPQGVGVHRNDQEPVFRDGERHQRRQHGEARRFERRRRKDGASPATS